MSTLTITIEAPEVVAAIKELTAALLQNAGKSTTQQVTPAPTMPAPVAPQVIPTTTVAPAQQQTVEIPTTAAAYTVEQLAYAASPLIDAGKLPQLQDLLKQFNVKLLTDLSADQYNAFATALRGLGAKI